MLKPRPAVLWLTGLSGAGKTTLAKALLSYCRAQGLAPILLDGDEMRDIMEQTGFDENSRKQHNLRVGRLASLLEKQDQLVIVAMISPYEEVRQSVKEMCTRYVEVYVATPLQACIERDAKGLYRKALSNEILNFTGISAPYEVPSNPELHIDTINHSVDDCVATIWEYYNSEELLK